jgi:tetratricopeptide (TPR) repeat protein
MSVFRLPARLGAVLVLLCVGMLPLPSAAQSGAASAALTASLQQVDSLRQAGDFAGALARLDSLHARSGAHPGILWRRSLTRVDRAKTVDDKDARTPLYEQALSDAKAALAADSTSGHAHLAIAVAEGRLALDAGTRERVRRSRAVKAHADRALALDSTLAGAYHVRGRWHREVDDLGFFERAIVKTVYGGLPDASFEQAVQDFRRAIDLEERTFHYLELGKTYLTMDRPAEARQSLQAAVDAPNHDPFAPRYKEEARELLDDLD